jgi:hypothetical protein
MRLLCQQYIALCLPPEFAVTLRLEPEHLHLTVEVKFGVIPFDHRAIEPAAIFIFSYFDDGAVLFSQRGSHQSGPRRQQYKSFLLAFRGQSRKNFVTNMRDSPTAITVDVGGGVCLAAFSPV